ncbi:GtrA family protein [Pontibacter silvestris]|uniref:GtrA family protein n=1 Tax=Pontibacter silvestris TaxID=2305183 RepID=A0ABW4WV62_9BACT|nr:GtrA family protein [Pontibacter silvestris]MCC9137793.1 GtrA family protein [Pontibacter silvestris]
MSVTKKAHKSQVLRFILVGGFCAGVEFILFAILNDFYGVKYLYANILSLLAAVVLNYFVSRKMVFERSKYSGRIEFTAFLIFTLMGVAMNQYLVWYFVEQVVLDANIGKALAIGVVAVFNYLTKKYVVFRK